MTQITWPVYSDDSGTLQDGTEIDAAFLDSIETGINALVHSTSNPTVTPAAIIDEVVDARGSLGSLDARLDVEHNEDGTHNLSANIVNIDTLDDAIGPQNLVRNAKVEHWSNGAAAAPDGYTLAGTGAAVARTGVGESDTTRKVGQYATKITYGSATASLTQTLIAAGDWNLYDYVENTVITGLIYIYTTTVNKVRAALYDGNTRTYFDNITLGTGTYHDGDGSWQVFQVSHTVSAAATQLDLEMYVEGAGNGVFSGQTVCLTGTAPDRFIEERPTIAEIEAGFVTAAASSDLRNERVLTAGEKVSVTDAGAGSTITLEGQISTDLVLQEDEMWAQHSGGGFLPGWHWTAHASTAPAIYDADPGAAGHPGVVGVETSVTANSRYTLFRRTVFPADVSRLIHIVSPRNSIAASMTMRIGLGRIDEFDVDVPDGIYFTFDPSSTATWRCVTKTGGTATTNDSSVTVTLANWYVLEIRKNGSSWEFWINGSLVATNSTNLETGECYWGYRCQQYTTAAKRQLLIDYSAIESVNTITQRYT